MLRSLVYLCVVSLSFSVLSTVPTNDLKFPAGIKSLHGVSQNEFEEIVSIFTEVFNPLVSEVKGKKLIIKKDWKSEKVNAYATRNDQNDLLIILSGGMARHPEMTGDGLLLILCHELGHHLGGAPKAKRGRSNKRSWSSAEGQADYFATNKCLPRIYKEYIPKVFDFNQKVSNQEQSEISKLCVDQSCTRIALASLAVAKVYSSLKSWESTPSLKVRDESEVYETKYGHPASQCRLDTMVAGISCHVPYDILFDNMDYTVGACVALDGSRPKCWFSSENY